MNKDSEDNDKNEQKNTFLLYAGEANMKKDIIRIFYLGISHNSSGCDARFCDRSTGEHEQQPVR